MVGVIALQFHDGDSLTFKVPQIEFHVCGGGQRSDRHHINSLHPLRHRIRNLRLCPKQ